MLKKTSIDRINLLNFFLIFLKFYKYELLFLTIFFIGIYIFLAYFGVAELAIYYAVLSIGLVISYLLHEYSHIIVFKIINKTGEMTIEKNWHRISIVPSYKVSGKNLIFVAISGPLICGFIGFLLLFSPYLIIQIVGGFFLVHLLFVLPPFGDGMMMIKGILEMTSKGGEKNGSDNR